MRNRRTVGWSTCGKKLRCSSPRVGREGLERRDRFSSGLWIFRAPREIEGNDHTRAGEMHRERIALAQRVRYKISPSARPFRPEPSSRHVRMCDCDLGSARRASCSRAVTRRALLLLKVIYACFMSGARRAQRDPPQRAAMRAACARVRRTSATALYNRQCGMRKNEEKRVTLHSTPSCRYALGLDAFSTA